MLKKIYPFLFLALALAHIIYMFASPFSSMKYVAKTNGTYKNGYGIEVPYSARQEIKKNGSALFSFHYQQFSDNDESNYQSISIYSYILDEKTIHYNHVNATSNTYKGSYNIDLFSLQNENIRYICSGRIFFFILDILLCLLGIGILVFRFIKRRKIIMQ